MLTKKLSEILKALHDRFIDEVDWFLITDDDTFVRVRPLQAFLSHLDPSQPHLIGGPVPTLPFLVDEDLKKFGVSYHCGGGSGIIMSRATLVMQLAQYCFGLGFLSLVRKFSSLVTVTDISFVIP